MIASDARKLSEWNSLSNSLRNIIHESINIGICNTRRIFKAFDAVDKMLYDEIVEKESVLEKLGYNVVYVDGPDVDNIFEYVYIQW